MRAFTALMGAVSARALVVCAFTGSRAVGARRVVGSRAVGARRVVGSGRWAHAESSGGAVGARNVGAHAEGPGGCGQENSKWALPSGVRVIRGWTGVAAS
ncbi:hypothetical protein ACTI_16990 [Actinoplanes sp. OR16]|nr:hypothetical protein ACTI_16990 [Actinoplanes sp. OR16]